MHIHGYLSSSARECVGWDVGCGTFAQIESRKAKGAKKKMHAQVDGLKRPWGFGFLAMAIVLVS
jgi:hypothetical protein